MTTYKYRDESGFVKRTIDYMFIAENNYFQQNKVVVQALMDPNDLETMKLIDT